MLLFLVCLALSSVVAIELGDPSGLYQNYVGDYAHSYHDYKPHDYEFGYGVSDPYTGDHKSQWEVKERGVVRGGYSLLEPDGTTRVVEYIADDHGFRAVVKKIDQHGNAQIESHGNTDDHHEVPIAAVAPLAPVVATAPAIQPIVAAEPIYQSYDGHVDNYVQNVEPVVVGKLAQPLEYQQQNYYQEPVIQQAPLIQKQIIQEPIVQAPIIQKQIVQEPIHYTPSPLTVEKQVTYDAPILQKQINVQQYYPEQLPIYKQQPIYNQIISKSPYVVDINNYGPKSNAVYVQPKIYQQAQEHYDIPESTGYYGQSNVLTPVAKGLDYAPQVTKQVYNLPSEYSVGQYAEPLNIEQRYEEPIQSYQPQIPVQSYQHQVPVQSQSYESYDAPAQQYYGTTVESDGAYSSYQDYPAASTKSIQQLPYRQVVGHPILH